MGTDKKKSRLHKRRTELNLTQEEVAKMAGISRPYYSMIENGRQDPSLKLAKKIAKILRSGVDALFYDK